MTIGKPGSGASLEIASGLQARRFRTRGEKLETVSSAPSSARGGQTLNLPTTSETRAERSFRVEAAWVVVSSRRMVSSIIRV